MDIIEQLSLRDKIGQMLILGFDGAEVSEKSEIVNSIKQDNLGGVILFDYHFQSQTFDKNIKSPKQVKALNQALLNAAIEGNQLHQRPNLPLLISVDYEGGKVDRLKSDYGFPTTISAQTFAALSEDKAKLEAQSMAKTLKNSGFNLDFAPVLDVNVNPENPVMGKLERSYSSDPQKVIEASQILVDALQAKDIICAYKHFPGHGSSRQDSHLGFVDVTDSWHGDELIPFKAFVEQTENQHMVMTAHIVNRHLDPSALPATLSYPMISEILRGSLNYDGVVITDDMQMKAISEHYGLEESLVMAINAGADMFIFGNQLSEQPVKAEKLIDLIEKNIKAGLISEARINQSISRIIHLKSKQA